ncbi:MAG: hypothetical protein ACREOH_18995, partial [Candidatus Entotheonellia bacterium]
ARPYKPALPQAEAVAILKRETEAGYWDPRITAAFITVIHGLDTEVNPVQESPRAAPPSRETSHGPE